MTYVLGRVWFGASLGLGQVSTYVIIETFDCYVPCGRGRDGNSSAKRSSDRIPTSPLRRESSTRWAETEGFPGARLLLRFRVEVPQWLSMFGVEPFPHLRYETQGCPTKAIDETEILRVDSTSDVTRGAVHASKCRRSRHTPPARRIEICGSTRCA